MIALLLAGGAAVAGGRHAAPFAKIFVTAPEMTFFGETFSQETLAQALGYSAVFVVVLGVLLFIWRERHGRNDKSGLWFVSGMAVAGLLGFLAFYTMNKHIDLTPDNGKKETGYKNEDRQKLEKLMHEGTKHD